MRVAWWQWSAVAIVLGLINILFIYHHAISLSSNPASSVHAPLVGFPLHATFPEDTVLARCRPVVVQIQSDQLMGYDRALEVMAALQVTMTCRGRVREPEELEEGFDHFPSTINRRLPFVPTAIEPLQLQALFYPDESVTRCKLTAISTNPAFEIVGNHSASYAIETNEELDPGCWWCEKVGPGVGCCAPLLHLPTPSAQDFLLQNDTGHYLFEPNTHYLKRGETQRFWIVPHPILWKTHGSTLRDLQFNAFLKSQQVIQNVDHISDVWDETRGGYAFTITGKDSEMMRLHARLNWVHAHSDVGHGPEPILVSSHIRHRPSYCEPERSSIAPSMLMNIVVNDPNAKNEVKQKSFLQPSTPRQCTNAMAEGRWLSISSTAKCRPPYCTGDREATYVTDMSWQGHIWDWLWVPYDCHYHFYTAQDVSHCAKQLNINWIHIMGDSLEREFAAYLMSLFNVTDTSKFQHADVAVDPHLRLTFLGWPDIISQRGLGDDSSRRPKFLKTILDHYNLLEQHTSEPLDFPAMQCEVPEQEEDSPDVVLLNGANAYALFIQSEKVYDKFLRDFASLIEKPMRHGRKGDGKRTQFIWYGNPYLHGTAHGGTEFITQTRNERFNELARLRLEPLGVRFFHSHAISRSRPEESWDGLHYLRGYEEWRGHVASTFIQAWLNELFAECELPETSR